MTESLSQSAHTLSTYHLFRLDYHRAVINDCIIRLILRISADKLVVVFGLEFFYNVSITPLSTNQEGRVNMARESKAEIQVRDSIIKYLNPNETLCEFSWGTKEESLSVIYFLLGALGAAFDRGNQTSFFVGLTDKRLILVEVKRKMPTGVVYNIAISDIKGLQYRSSGTAGNLNIHLSADILKLMFDRRPWWSRAKNMAKIMPLQK